MEYPNASWYPIRVWVSRGTRLAIRRSPCRRSCQRCGIADVTARAIGRDVETPTLITEVDHDHVNVGSHARQVRVHSLELTDFHCAVEGVNNTGKSNTLAAYLEDLAGTHVPTLIIVDARDEQEIDLADPIDQRDIVAEITVLR